MGCDAPAWATLNGFIGWAAGKAWEGATALLGWGNNALGGGNFRFPTEARPWLIFWVRTGFAESLAKCLPSQLLAWGAIMRSFIHWVTVPPTSALRDTPNRMAPAAHLLFWLANSS